MDILTYFIVFTLLLLPLGETTKIFLNNDIAFNIIDLVVIGISATWIISHIFTRKISVMTHHFLWKPFVLFSSIAFFSLVLNVYRYTPLQVAVAALYLLRWISFASLLFITTSLPTRSKNTIRTMLAVVGICCVIGGFVQVMFYPNLANLRYLGWDIHLYRMFTTFFDPNYGGAIFVLIAMYLLGMIFDTDWKKQRIKKIVLCIGESTTLIALFLTYSRSAYIMFFVSLIVLLILKKKTILLVPMIGLFLFGMIIASRNFYIENINIFRVASSEARLQAAGSAIAIIEKNPIIGVGFNAFRYAQVLYRYRDPKGAAVSHADAGTDNSFLFVLATTGVVGLLSYLYLWFCIGKTSMGKLKRQDTLSLVIYASAVGLLIDSFFNNSLFFPSIMLWMWILIGLSSRTTDYT